MAVPASTADIAPRLCLAGFAVGAVGLAFASRQDTRDRLRQRWLKFAVYLGVVYGMVFAYGAGRVVASALVGAITVGGLIELSRAVSRFTHVLMTAVLFLYLACAAAWLALTWTSLPGESMWIYLTVAAFDGFSQVSGQLFGKRAIAPRVSPGKTAEGVAGGLVGAILIGMALRGGADPFRTTIWCTMLSLAGLAGDLAASWVKRRVGWKDFSKVLPGHGGILDRFDSMLGAAPIALAMLSNYRP